MFNTDINTIFNSREVLNTLDRISDSEGKTISIIPFGSIVNIFERLLESTQPNRTARIIKSKKDRVLYKLETNDRRTGVLKASGHFIVYKMPNYEYSYLGITIEESDFFHKELRPFLKAFHTEVILSFIKSNELIKLIENYQSVNGLTEVLITRASQKIRYQDQVAMSTVTWNNSSLEQANDWLRDNNGFFKSIQFKAFRNGIEATNLFIDRRGIIRIQRNFSNAFHSFLKPNLDLIDMYIKLFKNRGRRENKLLEVRPLEINFERKVFEHVENNKQFIDVLSLLANTSVSVIHGNPYIHLSVVDYIDASSYDLWVVDSKQILLVPQLRSSIISLKRIVNHIFDYYAEGEIVDHEITTTSNY